MIDALIKTMAVYFLFIFIFGNKESKYHSAIIFISCFIVIVFPLEAATNKEAYIIKREIYSYYDGGTALILTMLLRKDKAAWKHALILAFATLCHIMIILSLINQKAGFFYNWYSELILMVGILQMMVSYDGITGAFSNLQELLLRTYHYLNRSYQSLFAHKDSEKRT